MLDCLVSRSPCHPQNAWQKCLDFQVPSGDEISDEVLMPRNTEATWVVIAEVHFMYRLRFFQFMYLEHPFGVSCLDISK